MKCNLKNMARNNLKILVGMASLFGSFVLASQQIALFDVKQFLPSARFDAQTRNDAGKFFEYMLWIDQLEENKSVSSLLIKDPVQATNQFAWMGSSDRIAVETIGLRPGTTLPVDFKELERGERSKFKRLFLRNKGLRSRLYFSDYKNEKGLSLQLYARVDQVHEPVSMPFQLLVYNVNVDKKVQILVDRQSVCQFKNVYLNEADKKITVEYFMPDFDGKCSQVEKLTVPLQ